MKTKFILFIALFAIQFGYSQTEKIVDTTVVAKVKMDQEIKEEKKQKSNNS